VTRTSRAVIGIVTYGRRDKRVENLLYDEHFASPALYTDAVRRAGGIPILLPPGETHVEDWLCAVDGVILTGGADIDPVHFSKIWFETSDFSRKRSHCAPQAL
jgi:putative glutamine amidotransferase